jgi:hypothetical protein
MVNSQDAAYEGNGWTNPGAIQTEAVAYDGFAQSIEIQVPQMALIVLRYSSDLTAAGEAPAAPSAGPLTAHPNPFNPRTEVCFELGAAAVVAVDVFDVEGRWVARLAEGVRPAGEVRAVWDGRDAAGRPAASGVYYVRAKTGGTARTVKTVLLR